LCGCGDDHHFSIKQPLLITPHLSSSPKQTQKEKENNTKKIKENKISLHPLRSSILLFLPPPPIPSSCAAPQAPSQNSAICSHLTEKQTVGCGVRTNRASPAFRVQTSVGRLSGCAC
jgi:hypothetical protein